jgi:hypothetical protein
LALKRLSYCGRNTWRNATVLGLPALKLRELLQENLSTGLKGCYAAYKLFLISFARRKTNATGVLANCNQVDLYPGAVPVATYLL